MKHFLVWLAFFCFFIILVPLCLNVAFFEKRNMGQRGETVDIDVYFASEDKVRSMDREEYILGVLMAEMPAEFEVEALKAQAVAARTYMTQKMRVSQTDESHKGADVCTDSTHCQAYVSVDDAMKKWGKNASSYFKKCKNAVNSTEGVIAVYRGEPIKAVFHAIGGGRTQNAEDVWGTSVEYLKSTDSPGDMLAPKFLTRVEVPLKEFKTKLKTELGIDFDNGGAGEIVRGTGGTVITAELGGEKAAGTKLRTVFGLRSACFDLEVNDKRAIFEVKGYGHGVGMSQYGANYCAKQGMKYDEILSKYYSGISLAKLS